MNLDSNQSRRRRKAAWLCALLAISVLGASLAVIDQRDQPLTSGTEQISSQLTLPFDTHEFFSGLR
jgi:hypothetical protein